jgi:hypothetical protein
VLDVNARAGADDVDEQFSGKLAKIAHCEPLEDTENLLGDEKLLIMGGDNRSEVE